MSIITLKRKNSDQETDDVDIETSDQWLDKNFDPKITVPFDKSMLKEEVKENDSPYDSPTLTFSGNSEDEEDQKKVEEPLDIPSKGPICPIIERKITREIKYTGSPIQKLHWDDTCLGLVYKKNPKRPRSEIELKNDTLDKLLYLNQEPRLLALKLDGEEAGCIREFFDKNTSLLDDETMEVDRLLKKSKTEFSVALDLWKEMMNKTSPPGPIPNPHKLATLRLHRILKETTVQINNLTSDLCADIYKEIEKS